MTEAITQEDFVKMISERAKAIDDSKLYYALRQYGIRLHVGSVSFKLLKIILSLHDVGIREFGAVMVASIAKLKFYETCWNSLHVLGDSHVLVKLRGVDLTRGVWMVSPMFLEVWEGKNNGVVKRVLE
jgi:hypothetical protein